MAQILSVDKCDCELVIVVGVDGMRVVLEVDGVGVDNRQIADMRNLSQSLLVAVDELLMVAGGSLGDLSAVQMRVDSTLTPEALSGRIARTTANIWNNFKA